MVLENFLRPFSLVSAGQSACQDGLWQKAPKYLEGMERVKDYFGKIQIDGAPVMIMGQWGFPNACINILSQSLEVRQTAHP